MINFIRLLQADCYKMKNTAFYKIHIIIPLIGSFLFLIYFATHSKLPYAADELVRMYIEVVSIAFPFMTSIVTSYIIEIEKEAGNYQEILINNNGRELALLSKIIILLCGGLISLLLTIVTITIGIFIIHGQWAYSLGEILISCLILFGCEIFIYLFHVMINLIFNKGLSILIGVCESIFAAIMLTGLGEVIWKYIPCGFEARIIGYYFLKFTDFNKYNAVACEVNQGISNCIIYTLVFFAILLIYFKFYEPKSNM